MKGCRSLTDGYDQQGHPLCSAHHTGKWEWEYGLKDVLYAKWNRDMSDDSESGAVGGRNFQLPMVACPDPHQAGQVLYVHRPYSQKEMTAIVSALLDPTKVGGCRFWQALTDLIMCARPHALDLQSVCRQKLGLAWGRVQATMGPPQGGQVVPFDPTLVFSDLLGGPYQTQLTALAAALRTEYPTRIDWQKVNSVKQKYKETCKEYLDRLQAALDDHGGLDRPNPWPGAEVMAYETQLANLFMNGLREPVQRHAKITCVRGLGITEAQ